MPRTIEEERAVALRRPITGKYPTLAKEVRRLLGYEEDDIKHFMTARQAASRAKISYGSMCDAVRGDRLRYESLVKLAVGLDGDRDKLLNLAGYDAKDYGHGHLSPAALSLLNEQGLDGTPDAAHLLGIYQDLSPERRQMLLAIARVVQSDFEK